MRYRISEISRLLGISPQSIRFYEKYGIVPCDVDKHNGYRTYDMSSIYTLLNSRQYQNCGFTVAETSELLQSGSVDLVRREYEEKSVEMEFHIGLQSRYLRRMREISAQLLTAEANVGQMVTVTSPDFVAVLYSFHNREERIPPDMAQKVSRWGKYMPLSGIMLYYSGYCQEEPALSRHSGFLMERRDAAFLGLERDEGVLSLPSRKCLYTIVEGMAQGGPVTEDFAPVFQHLRERRITPAAPPFTRGIVSLDRINTQRYLTEMWIPLE